MAAKSKWSRTLRIAPGRAAAAGGEELLLPSAPRATSGWSTCCTFSPRLPRAPTRDWELFTWPEPAGAEGFALLARTRQRGIHAFDAAGAGGGLLLKGALEHCPPRKVLANLRTLEAAVLEAGLRGRIVRDHRELFMLLPCGGLKVEPDGSYRLATATDLPRLEA